MTMPSPPPPYRSGRAPWTAWLAGVVSLLIISSVVGDAFSPAPEKTAGATITISRDDGTKVQATELMQPDELEGIFAHLPRNPDGFREALQEHRVNINLMLIAHSATRKTGWAGPVERGFVWVSLLSLLILLGPIAVYRRSAPPAHAAPAGALSPLQRALHSSPYFAVATAATMLALTVLPSIIIDIQSLQLGLAAAGAMDVALTDATMHLIIHEQNPALDGMLGQLGHLDTLVLHDPLAAFDLLEHLWRAAGEARSSSLFGAAGELFGSLSFVVDLYGPVLAVVTLLLVGRVLVPVLRNALLYPTRVVNAEDVPGAGRFLWSQITLIWAEVRIAFWLFATMLVITASAVVLVRAAAFPVAWMLAEALAVGFRQVMDGQPLPDVRLFCTGVSLAIALLAVTLLCLVPAGLVLSRAQTMLRTRHRDRRRFREFPVFWRVFVGLGLRVAAPSVLSFAVAVGAYAGLAALTPASWKLLLPIVVAPVMLAMTTRLRVLPKALKLARVDVLATEERANP